jgi:ATP-binding cassette subfamily B protein
MMGMGGGGGFAGGGMFAGGGGSRSAANPGGGLPFAGIPSEMQAGVEELLAHEPEHPEPTVRFSHRPQSLAERRRLSLRSLLTEHKGLLGLAGLLVVAVSLLNQAGPKLIQVGIDNGMVRRHVSVVVAAAVFYLVAVAVSAVAQRWQVMVTGRLAAWVMNDLRVKVFAHLQRLSLDFFTEEKAGVIMSRMTSDIENLQQLLQDGLAQLTIQALTMLVITGLLFDMNWRLAVITVVLVLPLLTAMSIWFRRASERGYDRVRDGIAGVLSDLSESLQGVRVVAAYNRQRNNVVHHRNVVGAYRDANNYTAQINALYGPGTQLLGYVAQAVLLAVGGEMVLHHSLTLGDLVAFFLYVNRFFSPIQLLVQQYNTYQQGSASVAKLRGLLTEEPSVLEREGAIELPPVEGRITFTDVTFSYGDGPAVLHDGRPVRASRHWPSW